VLDNLLQELKADNLHPRLADLRSYLPEIKDKLLLETIRATLIDRLTTIGIAAPGRLVDAVFNGHSPDQTPEPQSGMGGQGGQAKRLVSLLEHETLFCAPDGESAFAVVNTNGHREVWPIGDRLHARGEVIHGFAAKPAHLNLDCQL